MDYFKKYYGLVIVALLFLFPTFFSNYYILRLISTMGIYITIAMGLNIMLGYTGLISIGHAGIYGLAAYTNAVLIKTYHFNFWVMLLIIIVLGVFIGLFIGVVTLKLKQAYLAIVTLGFALIIQTVALNFREVTGGFEGFLGIPKPIIFGYKIKSPQSIYYTVLIVTILAFMLLKNVIASKWGRSMRAVRDDEIAASMMGINVVQTKLYAFTISSVLACVSGWLYSGLYGAVFPDYFNMDLSVLFLCMVVLGGSGTVLGPIVGAVLITVGLEILRGLGEGQMLVYGALIVCICVFKPGGIIEIAHDIKKLIKHGGHKNV